MIFILLNCLPGDLCVDDDVAADGVERPDHAAHVLEGERPAAGPGQGRGGGGGGGGRVGPVQWCNRLLLLLLTLGADSIGKICLDFCLKKA